jgi:hypothetical protein
MGNKVLDAGAILKSPAPALAVAVLSDVVLLLLAVLASFCCAQSGRANKTPIATVAHHLRIVFLPEFDPKKPVYLMRLHLNFPLRRTEDAWQYAALDLFLFNGRYCD